MARMKAVATRDGGISVSMSVEEDSARDAEEAAWNSEAPDRAAKEVQNNRRQAYQEEADPLFFEEQRGEVSAGTHAAKVAEIKVRFPK